MRRRRASLHRVRRSTMITARTIPEDDDWSAVTTGLLAAGHLRILFPDFYATHVACLHTTPRVLLGIVQAFFSLAQQKVELLLSDELETNPRNPCLVLDPGEGVDDDWALGLIAQSAGRDVRELWPAVYGLDLDDENMFGFGAHPQLVAVLCWVLADETAWSLPYCTVDQLVPAVQRQLYQCRIDPAILNRLGSLPRLPATTPMETLCNVLDTQPPIHGCMLGRIVRYCFHATGNQFADLSYDTVAQMDSSNLDWCLEDLDEVGRLQREARQLATQYEQLNGAALRSVAVVNAIIEHILTVAGSLHGRPI